MQLIFAIFAMALRTSRLKGSNRSDRKENPQSSQRETAFQITQLPNYKISQSASFLPVKIHEQIGSFVHTHTMKLRGFQLRREALPDRDGKILRGWNAIGKLRHFFVEEAMVHGIENFAVQDFF